MTTFAIYRGNLPSPETFITRVEAGTKERAWELFCQKYFVDKRDVKLFTIRSRVQEH